MWEVIQQRERKPFESFADISARIKSIPHPERMIVSRILHEIEDPEEKYHIITSK